MGVSVPSLHILDDTDMSSAPTTFLALEIQNVRRHLQEKKLLKSSGVLHGNRRSMSTSHVRKNRSAAMGERQRRPLSRVERRVRTLERLVPSPKSMDLDGLFQETTDYIMSLEMQVKVMKILVKVLSDSH